MVGLLFPKPNKAAFEAARVFNGLVKAGKLEEAKFADVIVDENEKKEDEKKEEKKEKKEAKHELHDHSNSINSSNSSTTATTARQQQQQRGPAAYVNPDAAGATVYVGGGGGSRYRS